MIVVADTSVILNLCCVGYDELLHKLYGKVCVPIQVNEEFSRLTQGVGRFSGCSFPSWISVIPPSLEYPPAVKAADLDKGESAAITLCLELHADLLLIDESLGRTVAHQLQIRTIGILGVLLEAKRSGLIPSVAEVLNRLESEARFWIAPELRKRVLALAGE